MEAGFGAGDVQGAATAWIVGDGYGDDFAASAVADDIVVAMLPEKAIEDVSKAFWLTQVIGASVH